MSTVFSLVCWGGRTGKTVSLSASTDVVTLTNHGLRNGTKLWPSGTLPSELNTSTPVYARSTAANTFTLHTSSAGAIENTGQITFAGSSTYAAVVLKSDLVANPSVALAPYGLSDLSRWGTSGSERVYDGLANWNSGRSGADSLDVEVAEIGEAFDEDMASTLSISVPAGATTVTSKINGIYSGAFHAGVINDGYRISRPPDSGVPSVLVAGNPNTTIDGFTVRCLGGGGYSIYGFRIGVNCLASRIISIGRYNGLGYGTGLQTSSRIDNCVFVGWAVGIYFPTYLTYPVVSNCIATANTTGVGGAATTNITAVIYNTVSIGNTVNWTAPTTGSRIGAKNAGDDDGAGGFTGGTPWGDTPVGIETTDLVDISGTGTAPNWSVPPDLRPASGSPLIDAGVEFYGATGYDITGAERPNYNNGGAEAYDIGAYEYDHGYGPHPASTTVTFSGVIAGSEIHVYDATDTELTGVESCSANHQLTWSIPANPTVSITIIKRGIRPQKFPYQSAIGNQTIPLFPQPDLGYNNPA